MLSIFIIGNGRMATHLIQAFQETDVEIAGFYARNSNHAEYISAEYKIPFYSDLSSIPKDCDVYFLAVSDTAISQLSEQLKVQGLVVHCSGMAPIHSIKNQTHSGVFWPIQSFNIKRTLEYAKIPICIEANSEENLRILEALADRISKKVMLITEAQRQYLHLSAVFVNNFTNHLFILAQDILHAQGLTFDLLLPLIQETIERVKEVDPRLVQTGPASRNDSTTLVQHEKLLEEQVQLLDVYKMMSKSILEYTQKG